MAKIEKNRILKQRTLNELIETLKEHNKNSCKYLDAFYNQCKDGGVGDLEWVENDNDFMYFVGGLELEYNRVYDIAVLNITNQQK